MQVRFFDGSSNEITSARYDSGSRNESTWAQYGITNYTIPAGARTVQVRFNTWEYDGSSYWDAGSADDFSVKVTVGVIGASAKVIPAVNDTANTDGLCLQNRILLLPEMLLSSLEME